MIEVYKILNGIYDSNVVPSLMRNHDNRTRGNDFKLIHNRARLNIRKYSFANRSELAEYVAQSGCSFGEY